MARHGDRCAIRFEGRDISSREIQVDARRLAKALAASGVAKGMRVAVHMANRPEFAVASFAIAMLGAVMVPVNTFATPDEREYILRHGDSALLLFQRTLLKHNFLDELLQHAARAERSDDGPLHNTKTPYLRQVVALGLAASARQRAGLGQFSGAGQRFSRRPCSMP